MSAPQQQPSLAYDSELPVQRGGPVATRVRIDHVHTCPTCGAPRRVVSQNTPNSSRMGISEWHVVRIDCAGSCCSGATRACPVETDNIAITA